MADAIPTWFVRGYQSGVRMLQQQMTTRLRGAVLVDDDVNENRRFYDHAGETQMHDVENRHGDTEYDDHPLSRRMVTLKTKEVAKLVDRADRRRLLNDPINPYTRMQAAAASRKIDDVILQAFDAVSKAGEDGDTDVSFPAAFSFAEATATAFAVVDLSKARRILEAAENEEDGGDDSWHIVCSASQREKLRDDPTLTSNDYAVVKALVDGQVNMYMGLQFHRSQRGAIDGSNIRDVFVWVKQSMQLAISQDFTSFIDILPAKRHSIQVRTELDVGATRMDEKGVVRILADET